MSFPHLTGFLVFAFITSITPGPNNILLFSHGKNFGFKHSGKLIFGIFLGFFLLLLSSGYGIASIIVNHPSIGLIVKIFGSIWLLYIAILLKKTNTNSKVTNIPALGFWKILVMQFSNPKAWVMAIAGVGAFLPDLGNIHLNVFVFAFVFCITGLPCMIIWVLAGDAIARIFNSSRSGLIITNALFLLMLISIVLIWL